MHICVQEGTLLSHYIWAYLHIYIPCHLPTLTTPEDIQQKEIVRKDGGMVIRVAMVFSISLPMAA